ncbi:MAG TPA: hypothetical protein VFE47_05660 [Tepidisphaeraceae bacterium]|jgi:hypothetical protein|nr:hypothetical protein [Tepidisphaeraceae bacterium]
MSSPTPSIKRTFTQPAFIVVVLVLAICGATLNATVKYFQLTFHKRAVPIRVSLKTGVPQTLGHWVCVSPDTAINPEIQQVLGTSEYIFRDYVDSRKVGADEIELLKKAPTQNRDIILAEIQSTRPSAVIRCSVTYYTGSADTVAHVPERCMVADGFAVKEYETVEKPAVGNYPDGTPRDLDFRFLGFEDQTAVGQKVQRVARNVGYVFHCDGEYESSPYRVRQHLENLFERYGYYAKVEMMTAATVAPGFHHGSSETNDKADSKAAMVDFLSDALPEIEKCLPDWKALHKPK